MKNFWINTCVIISLGLVILLGLVSPNKKVQPVFDDKLFNEIVKTKNNEPELQKIVDFANQKYFSNKLKVKGIVYFSDEEIKMVDIKNRNAPINIGGLTRNGYVVISEKSKNSPFLEEMVIHEMIHIKVKDVYKHHNKKFLEEEDRIRKMGYDFKIPYIKDI